MTTGVRSDLQPATYLGLLQGQLAVSITNPDGSLKYATGVQDTGVLDDLYAYTGSLGVIFRHAVPPAEWQESPSEPEGDLRVKVWAPTAQTMELELFKDPTGATPNQVVPMHEYNGLWVATLPAGWTGKYYLFDETVYAPSTRTIVENFVTDPYSADLALNGVKTRMTDLDSETNKPAGWDADRSPVLDRLNVLSIYELHVRDFSVGDAHAVPAHRGTYMAFADKDSDGSASARVGSSRAEGSASSADVPLQQCERGQVDVVDHAESVAVPPDGQQQQAAVTAIQSTDAYNWGYDPDHYLAPEGAYATNSYNRVVEYRRMVMALHEAGLRVIQGCGVQSHERLWRGVELDSG